MEAEKKDFCYDDHKIGRFGTVTYDDNWPHDKTEMAKIGVIPIVQGMATLTVATNLVGNYLKDAKLIQGYFGAPILSGEEVELSTESRGLDFILGATNHRGGVRDNFLKEFTLHENRNGRESVVRNSGCESYNSFEGVERTLEYDPNFVPEFGDLIGAEDLQIRNFLYSIACSSWALIEGGKNPKTPEEGELAQYYGNDKRAIIYKSITANIPYGLPDVDDRKPFTFKTNPRFIDKKKRNIEVDIACSQEELLLYYGKYRLAVGPKAGIKRIVRQGMKEMVESID